MSVAYCNHPSLTAMTTLNDNGDGLLEQQVKMRLVDTKRQVSKIAYFFGFLLMFVTLLDPIL
jgi:hypothetical protein